MSDTDYARVTDPKKAAKYIYKDMKEFVKNPEKDSYYGTPPAYELYVCTESLFQNGKWEEYMQVGFKAANGKRMLCPNTDAFVGDFGRELTALVSADKKLMVVQTRSKTRTVGYWNTREEVVFSVPAVVRAAKKPCKEWNTLSRLVKKGSGIDLDPMKCYLAEVSGKRGRLYSEGGRFIVAIDEPAWCGKAVDWLRKTKTSRDTLKVEPYIGEYCEDRQHSAEYEVECRGERLSSYEMEVLTPTGRSKGKYIISAYGSFYTN